MMPPRPVQLAALLIAAGPVFAQPEPAAPPADDRPQADTDARAEAESPPDEPPPAPPVYTRQDRLDQLADEDHAVRVAAMSALLQDDTIDEPALAQLLADAEYPEQRRRLTRIAEHHLMRLRLAQVADELRGDGPADQAAVGFAYNPVLPDDNPHGPASAVVILDTMPGFPGHAYLYPGDLILAIDGRTAPVASVESIRRWLGGTIGRHRAGDTLRLTVVRAGDTIELDVPCAGIKTLNEAYTTAGNGETSRNASYQDELDRALARLTEGIEDDSETLVPAPAE